MRDDTLHLIAQPSDGVEVSVFDPVMHARVILLYEPDSLADPVQAALARSPQLGPTFDGRILRHSVEGFPAPQVVLFDTALRMHRTAPIDLQGEQQRICTLAFPQDASVYELTLCLARACEAPPTLRFQVARRVCTVDVNGLNVPRFDAGTLQHADVIEFRHVQLHWAPRFRTSIEDLLQRDVSATPELLLPLQPRRSFSHPVDSVVVHRPGRPFVRVPYEPHLRPGALRAHVLHSVGSSADGLMKVPLLSPHFQAHSPHVFVLTSEEIRQHPHWALFDVRRVTRADVPFFLVALPARVSLGFVAQLIHDCRPDVGPIAGVFHNNSLLDDNWTPTGQLSLMTVVAPGSDLLLRPPAVWFTADLLESNLGYQTAFYRYEEPRRAWALRAPQTALHMPSSTTSTTNALSWEEEIAARRPIHPDPVREGPQPRDPRDHIVCVAASAQCPPGAFTFHRSVDLPEIPARVLYYVSRHAFVPKLPSVSFSPVVYRTHARIPLLFAAVRDEIEHQVFVWIDAMPAAPYPVFQALEGFRNMQDVYACIGVVPPAKPFAAVNGQIWSGQARSFCFGDVIQLRTRRDSLITLSLDSNRFCLPHAALLYRPVIGPEMRCRSTSVQLTPIEAYKPFTRQFLYDHFKRIYTAWARELVLLPGSRIVFVGPDLPVIRIPTGIDGQPSRELAQALYNSVFSHLVGDRRVQAMRLQLGGAWLFAAVPDDGDSTTWVYQAHWGLALVHCGRYSSQLRTHPLIERSVLVPSIDFGPVTQYRTLAEVDATDLPLEGTSLLQRKARLKRAVFPAMDGHAKLPTPCRSSRGPPRLHYELPLATTQPSAVREPHVLWTVWGPGHECRTRHLTPSCTLAHVLETLQDEASPFGRRLVPLSPADAFPQECLLAPMCQGLVTFLLREHKGSEVCTFCRATARFELEHHLRQRGLSAAYCMVPLGDLTGELFDGMAFDCSDVRVDGPPLPVHGAASRRNVCRQRKPHR